MIEQLMIQTLIFHNLLSNRVSYDGSNNPSHMHIIDKSLQIEFFNNYKISCEKFYIPKFPDISSLKRFSFYDFNFYKIKSHLIH